MGIDRSQIEKWRTARVSVSLNVLAFAILVAVVAAMSALVLFTRSPKPQVHEIVQGPIQNGVDSAVEDELVEVARYWTEDNIDGAVGDELVKFIVEMSNNGQPEEFGMFVKERLRSATTWSYGPIVDQGDRYEITAMASTRIHEIVPVRYIGLPEDAEVRNGLDGYQEVVTMPFHLTIDLGSKSVFDWHVHADEGTYNTNGLQVSMEEVYGEAVAKCVRMVLVSGLQESLEIVLFTEPRERERIEASELNEAISEAGLSEVCEEWLGEPLE